MYARNFHNHSNRVSKLPILYPTINRVNIDARGSLLAYVCRHTEYKSMNYKNTGGRPTHKRCYRRILLKVSNSCNSNCYGLPLGVKQLSLQPWQRRCAQAVRHVHDPQKSHRPRHIAVESSQNNTTFMAKHLHR